MKFCALTPYNLDRFSIPKIEPVFDRQALTIISGFIQWKRSAGNDNIPFVPKCAGESPLDRVVGMIPGDVLAPQGSYDFLTGACVIYRSANLVQYPILKGITPKTLHLTLHPVIGHKIVSVFINPIQYQRRISHQGVIRYWEKEQFTSMVSDGIVGTGIYHRPPEYGKGRTAEYRPGYTGKYPVGNIRVDSDESTIAPEIFSNNICLVLMESAR